MIRLDPKKKQVPVLMIHAEPTFLHKQYIRYNLVKSVLFDNRHYLFNSVNLFATPIKVELD